MSKILKGLAIAVLLITVIGAGVVLYGLSTMEPRVEQIMVSQVTAEEAPEAFEDLLGQLDDETFTGTLFGSTEGLDAQSCTFITYTVRMTNTGFFPAEWLSLEIQPQQSADGASRDVLQMGGEGAYVLAAGSSGDLSGTILRTGDASDVRREIDITCYVFGQKMVFSAQAE